MSHSETVFTPYRLGDLELPNRLVMAPLTRNRAGVGGVPTPLMAEYYAQRASAGLIIAEASQISSEAQGYTGTPGIYTEAQIAGWELVTHAVHTCGGRIFLQLWHVGRISHVSLQPGRQPPVAPSAIKADAQTFVDGEFTNVSDPRALDGNEIRQIVEAYAVAAKNALWAGFDGIEVHAANGYLIDQFLHDGSNNRTDEFGGSIENRTRFLSQIMKAVIEVANADCVGVRISPDSTINDVHDSDPSALFNHVVSMLDGLKPVYLHVIEGQTGVPRNIDPAFDFGALRKRFQGTYIANNDYDLALANAGIDSGAVDLVAFGRDFISNPDLVERFRVDAPLNAVDTATLYGGGAEGYTDYPTLVKHSAKEPAVTIENDHGD
jgi:N-ethylmaleimide reductase